MVNFPKPAVKALHAKVPTVPAIQKKRRPMFTGLGKAGDAMQRLPYLPSVDGEHILSFDQVKFTESKKKDEDRFFIFEFQMLATSVEGLRLCTYSRMCNLRHAPAGREIKAVFSTIRDVCPAMSEVWETIDAVEAHKDEFADVSDYKEAVDEAWSPLLEWAIGEEQPLRGVRIGCRTEAVANDKDPKKPYCRANYFVVEQTDDLSDSAGGDQ